MLTNDAVSFEQPGPGEWIYFQRNLNFVSLLSGGELLKQRISTVELQWLEHLWDYENVFETGVVRANEGLI